MSDIAALFAKDPMELTRDDIDAEIEYYRKARANFNTGEKAAGSTKKMKEASAGPTTKVTALNLDDLLG